MGHFCGPQGALWVRRHQKQATLARETVDARETTPVPSGLAIWSTARRLDEVLPPGVVENQNVAKMSPTVFDLARD